LQQLGDGATFLGSMLFSRGCSGSRVVNPKEVRKINNVTFTGYGSHSNNYPFPYLTVAAAIGVNKTEIDQFIFRLDKTFSEYKKKNPSNNPQKT